MEAFERARTSWTDINLGARREEWDATAKSLAEMRELTKQERGALAGRSKAYTMLTDEAEKAIHLGPLMKSYQQMINSLVERQRVAAAAFVDAYSVISCAPDPVPVLNWAKSEMQGESTRSLAELKEENRKLKMKVSEFEVEFLSLTNQDAKIAALQERLATYNAKIDEVVAAAVERKLGETISAEAEDLERLRVRDATLQDELHRIAAHARETEQASAHSDALSQRLAEEVSALQKALDAQQTSHASEVEVLNGRVAELTADCLRLQRTASLASAVAGAANATGGGAPVTSSAGDDDGAVPLGGGSPNVGSARKDDEALHHQLASSPYVERLCAQLRLAEQSTAKLEAQLSALQAENEALSSRAAALSRAVAAAPSARAHDRLVARVKVLEAAGRSLLGADLDVPSDTDADKSGSAISGGDRDGRTARAVADAMKGRVRAVEQSLLEATRALADMTARADAATARAEVAEGEVARLARLVGALEEDVAGLTGGMGHPGAAAGLAGAQSGGLTGSAAVGVHAAGAAPIAPAMVGVPEAHVAGVLPAAAANAVPPGDAAAAPGNRSVAVLAAQRDRFKQQAAAAEVRAAAAERRATAAEEETSKLRAAHSVQLTSPVMRGGVDPNGGGAGNGGWGGGATRRRGGDDADRYAADLRSHADVEAVRRGVNAAERYAMRGTTALLLHRKARLLFFGYLLFVHILMFAILHRQSTHRCHPQGLRLD